MGRPSSLYTAPSARTIPVEIFMAGDILFYAIALGK
jgi:hypothetical protein